MMEGSGDEWKRTRVSQRKQPRPGAGATCVHAACVCVGVAPLAGETVVVHRQRPQRVCRISSLLAETSSHHTDEATDKGRGQGDA